MVCPRSDSLNVYTGQNQGNMSSLKKPAQCVQYVDSLKEIWARILKHLLEAEKSTFGKELSLQRSESTAGPG